ncbi:hypothetical protein, partial [Xylella fastidiosa]|uniref:hypothetical protein n=1 Tax=Xylella fastidiosa TaxID=2371 RepID=UPI001F17EA4F
MAAGPRKDSRAPFTRNLPFTVGWARPLRGAVRLERLLLLFLPLDRLLLLLHQIAIVKPQANARV